LRGYVERFGTFSRWERTRPRKDDAAEFVFEPQAEGGGSHAYSPDPPGLHTQGDTLEEAVENAEEALAVYCEQLRDEGRQVGGTVLRRRFRIPA
jgi:predicted RNase H-like HicB family nuclease